jgi:hypothetical protein
MENITFNSQDIRKIQNTQIRRMDSSVRIMTDYNTGIRFPTGTNLVSLPHGVRIGSVVCRHSRPLGSQNTFARTKEA